MSILQQHHFYPGTIESQLSDFQTPVFHNGHSSLHTSAFVPNLDVSVFLFSNQTKQSIVTTDYKTQDPP